MKASFRFILAALAATAALVGCTKEITPNFENDKVNPEGSRIIAVSFAPQTKTTLDGLQPKFEDGKDTVLISNTNDLDTCVVSVKDNKATISTNLTGPLTAVYPYTAAGMSEDNGNEIDTVLVSTVQSGKFADANICMAKMTSGNDKSLSFENKTAVFKIIPVAGESTQYVEVSADGFEIANDVPTGSTHTSLETIHVNTTSADSVYVSILVPEGLTVGDLKFSDGTNEKAITTGAQATEEIAAGTLYTVTATGWESPAPDIPGAINGKFSVSDDKQVYFSQGNLYAKNDNSGTWIWGFYDKQYKFHSESMTVISSSGGNRAAAAEDTEIDLFTWGYDKTSANASYSLNPVNTAGITGHNSDGENFSSAEDWGSIAGLPSAPYGGGWRTLTKAECEWLLGPYSSQTPGTNCRKSSTVNGAANARYLKCKVDNSYGLMIFPDTFNWPAAVSAPQKSFINNRDLTWDKVPDYTVSQFEALEVAGVVFLPAAGYRSSTSVNNVGKYGTYWSSTSKSSTNAYYLTFYSSVYSASNSGRFIAKSVRLVTDVSSAPTPAPTEPDYVVMKMGGDQSKELKWAKMNLGAEKVATDYRCYGDYYQWGSVDKLYSSIAWTDNTTGSFVGLKEGGFAETNLTYKENADLSDATNDVVMKTYPGTGWRMPTKQEFQDLYDACVGTDEYDNTTKPTTGKPTSNGVYWCDSYDGVAGVLFYDGTNVLFFPATGGGFGTGFGDAGSFGGYWSSSLITGDTDFAYGLDFDSVNVNPQFNYYIRYYGRSVRPVSD